MDFPGSFILVGIPLLVSKNDENCLLQYTHQRDGGNEYEE